MAKHLLQFFILFSIVVFQSQACFIGRITFHVRNALPKNSPSLKLHCASGSRELGYHNLSVGQGFSYDFCLTLTSLFFCHLWWMEKDIAFEVFNSDWPQQWCETFEGFICY
ncbi:hypothetical protein PHJA_000951200 [Phtheirospermum japonicum]|uniref:S-protein homolog n=1 Tax=Phtheirospermum japonicum TaxID=374723 RepID=A0A830BXG2_9LAMI|nr:hypothetical protein PHJA_000951200 [Phtheirospermum japonicum]